MEVGVIATRRERVILELEDNFTADMIRAASAAKLLDRELNNLSGKSVETSRDTDRLQRSLANVGDEATRTSSKFDGGTKAIDRYSGRLGLLVDAAVTLGPALIPISAAAIPAVAGLTAGLGAAAGALGVTVLAFQGMGDAIKAVNTYELQPTTENLAKMRLALEQVGPAGAEFVRFIADLEPALHALQNTARSNLFPGLQAGIEELLPLLPQVQQIVANFAAEMGRLSQGAGEALGGPKFREFFNYLETDGATILHRFAAATGNVVEGIGHLVTAFGPLTLDFTSGLERMTRSFANWADGLSRSQGFQDFVDYIRQSGPQVREFLGAFGDALIGIAKAAAPWGSTVLPVLTALAQALGAIANSPIGGPLFTAAAGFMALNRAVTPLRSALTGLSTAFSEIQTSPDRASAAISRFSGAARVAAGAGGIGLFVAGLHNANEGIGSLESVAGGALAGFSVGGPWGAAIGGAVGALTTLGHANEDTSSYVRELTGSLDEQTGALTGNSRAIAAKSLEDSGILKLAADLGVNLGTVTDAALGNKDAMALLTSQSQKYADVTGPGGQVDQGLYQQRMNYDKLVSKVGDFAGATDSTVAAQRRVAAATDGTSVAFQRNAERLQQARGAAQQTAQGFITLGDSLNDAKVSLGDWIKQLQQQADALANFGRNAADAARRGLSEGLIKELQKAGPEGAMRMRQLANGTEKEIARANKAWFSGQRAARRYADTVGGLRNPRLDVTDGPMLAKMQRAQDVLRKYGLTKSQASLLIQDLATGKIKTVQDLVDKYGMSKKTATALLNDLASGKIRAIQGLLNSLHDKTVSITTLHVESYINKRSSIPMPGRDVGGFTGYGGKYEPAGVVHRGEVVLPQEIVRRDKSLLMSRYGFLPNMDALPGFASGGAAGFGANQSGITSNSQLYGINKAWLSIDELADRITNLSHRQLRDLASEVDDLNKRGLKKLSSALDQVRSNLEKEAKSRANLIQKAQDIRSGIASGLRQDIFAAPSNPWSGAAGDPNSVLRQNIARDEEFDRLIRQLKSKGVDGAALQAIIASGDIERARLMAGMSRSYLSTYERLFGQENRAARTAGQTAVQALGISRDIREMTHEMKGVRQEIRQIQHAIQVKEKRDHESRQHAADRTGAHVNGAAKNGHRHGQKG